MQRIAKAAVVLAVIVCFESFAQKAKSGAIPAIFPVPDSMFVIQVELSLKQKFNAVTAEKNEVKKLYDILAVKCEGQKKDLVPECRGEIQKYKEDKSALISHINTYNKELEKKLEERMPYFTSQMTLIGEQMKGSYANFNVSNREFNRWDSLAVSQQTTLIKQVKDDLLALAEAGGKNYIADKFRPIGPVRSEELKKKWLDLGIDNPDALALLDKFKNPKDKAEFTITCQRLVALGCAITKTCTPYSSKTAANVLDFTYGVVSFVCTDPRYKVGFMAIKNGYELIDGCGALVYGFKAVNDLTQITEQQLKTQEKWINMQRSHGKNKKKATELIALIRAEGT